MASDHAPGENQGQPIRELEVRNFGCLKDTKVSFAPFTVLVGPNDSGKSLILRALERLAVGVNESQPIFTRESFTPATFNRNDMPIMLGICGEAGSDTYRYEVTVEKTGQDIAVPREKMVLSSGVEGDNFRLVLERSVDMVRSSSQSHREAEFPRPRGHTLLIGAKSLAACSTPRGYFERNRRAQAPFESLHNIVKRAVPFRLDTNRIRQAVPFHYAPRNGIIDPDGYGVAKAIADFLLQRRDVIPRIEDALRQAMPYARGVNAPQVGDGFALEIEAVGGARIDNTLVSDGVLLFLAYLLLVVGADPTPILLIEEPETGIHPGLLEKVVGFLRDLAYGDPPVQVIITTHSPILLNFVEPEEIRVVERQEDGGTKVFPFQDAPDLERLLQYQGPGEVWVNKQEKYITQGHSEE